MNTSDPHQPQTWLRRLGRSMRWRLLVLFLLLAFAMSAAFIGGSKKAFSTGWREAVKPLLTDYLDRLAQDIGSPPDANKARALVTRLPISVRIDGPTTQFDSHPQSPAFRSELRPDLRADFLRRTTPDGHTITFGLDNMEWRRGPGVFAWLTLALLLGLTALAFVYVRRLFQPLDDISAGVQRFGAGNFEQAITVRRRDELGDLAVQINTMGHEIAQMLDAKRALLLAISHELRSPLTRARLNTELLPDSSAEQDAKGALLRDLTEMTRIITDLLESERLSGSHAALNLEVTDLSELIEDAARHAAAHPPLSIHIDAKLPSLSADRARIKLLLRNLLDNAQRHGQSADGQATALRLGRVGNSLVLTVHDRGPGVAPDQLPQLGQAFFRADSARQRSTGGVGLGLYLCRLIAQAHGGELTLENAEPGLRVCVTLPL
jgi:signal transduction histidine kinase